MIVRRTRVLAGTLALLALLPGMAQGLPAAQFDPAFALFARANAGEKAAIEPAAEAFEKLLQAEPANPVLMAYSGAATAMRATTSWAPWKKMRYAEDGLALIDKALALPAASSPAVLQHQMPAVLEVRYTAASTFLAVPEFMNRQPRGASLLAEVLGSPLLNSAPLEFRGNVWLSAARQAAAQGQKAQARGYLDQIIRSGAPQAATAQKQLAELAP
jgi:hypothetical protein